MLARQRGQRPDRHAEIRRSLARGCRLSSNLRGMPPHHRLDSGGNTMGKEARIGLLLASTCCLLAVMVDWIVEELN